MKILGIIPARGGSKSVPRKNVKILGGRPLISYTIQEAFKSKFINRLLLTTDDEEIAAVAQNLDVEVPFLRPKALALDHVTDLPVFQHCLKWLEQEEGYTADLVVHLRPTAPLRTAKHIDKAISIILEDSSLDSVRSVCEAGQHPLKMWGKNVNRLEPFIPEEVFEIREAYNSPRQKLPKAFVQNGSVDIIRTSVILEKNSMSGDPIGAYVMDVMDSVNIDTLTDWQLAELTLNSKPGSDT